MLHGWQDCFFWFKITLQTFWCIWNTIFYISFSFSFVLRLKLQGMIRIWKGSQYEKLFSDIPHYTYDTSLLCLRLQSTCFTTSGSRRSPFPLVITTWRWHADPWRLVSPTCSTSSASVALSTLFKPLPSRSMFLRAKGTVHSPSLLFRWLF